MDLMYGTSENECLLLRFLAKNIGMEFGIRKCGVIIMNRGKVKATKGIQSPSDEKIR